MTQNQTQELESILTSFYNFALKGQNEFTFFSSSLNSFNLSFENSKLSQKQKFEKLAIFIQEYIKTFSNNLSSNILKNASSQIACCILEDSLFLQTFNQGGCENFIKYIKLCILENSTKNPVSKIAIIKEKLQTKKQAKKQ